MKILLKITIVIALLLLQGCAKSEDAGTPAESQIPAEQSIVTQVVVPTPSEDAASIGITAENYPRIDGSTSTFPLVQGIYKRMFLPMHGGGEGWPGMPQKASKTMASYEMLINGDVDLIIVSDPSKEVKRMADSTGSELEYIPIGAEALV